MLASLIEAGVASARLSDKALEQIRAALELLGRADVQQDPEMVAKLHRTVALSLEALRNVATSLAEVNALLEEERAAMVREGGSADVIPFPSTPGASAGTPTVG